MDTTLKLAALKHGFEVKREEEEDMKSTLVMPAEFDLKRGKIVSAQAWVKYLHLRIAQQSLAHRLPPMSQLAFECTVIEGVMDDIWDQLQGLIRDPFLTDAQHAELTRRLPFVIADIIIRFFVAFVRKSNESVANKVFSAKVNSIRAQSALRVELEDTLRVEEIRRDLIDLIKSGSDTLRDDPKTDEDPTDPRETNFRRAVLHQSHKSVFPVQSGKKVFEDIKSMMNEMAHLNKNNSDESRPTHHREYLAHLESMFPGQVAHALQSKYGIQINTNTQSVPLLREPSVGSHASALPNGSVIEPSQPLSADMVEEDAKDDSFTSIPGAAEIPDELEEYVRRRVARDREAPASEDPDPILLAYTPVRFGARPTAAAPAESNPPKRYLLSHRAPPRKVVEEFALEVKEDLEDRVEKASKMSFSQIDSVSTRLSSGEPVILAHHRVTDRIPKTMLVVTPAKLLYREMDSRIDPLLLRKLDEPLYLREKLKDVYSYLSKQLESDFLSYEPPESDRGYVHAPQMNARDLVHVFTSARIRQGTNTYNRVILNTNLLTNKDDAEMVKPPESQLMTRREAWIPKWKATFTQSDYMTSLPPRNLDFLCVCFGLFPAKLMLSDAELIAIKDKEEALRKEREAAVQHIIDAQQKLKEKTSFKRGFWNVQTIGQDGLAGHSSVNGLVVPPDEDSEAVVDQELSITDMETLHAKLNALWTKLLMPPIARMTLMIKYSSKTFAASIIEAFRTNQSPTGPLNETLALWESVTNAVLRREECLGRLEVFERTASDPARYFAKGDPEAASKRLTESRDRGKLHRELKRLSQEALTYIDLVFQRLGDRVTFGDRDYKEKMQHDQVEMLYWLQQERRQAQLQGTALILPPLIAHSLPDQLQLPDRIGSVPLRAIRPKEFEASTALSASTE